MSRYDFLNYDFNVSNVLSIKDIKYMMEIVNSDLSEIEKAEKLYSFCTYVALNSSYNYYAPSNMVTSNGKLKKNVEKNFNEAAYAFVSLTKLKKIYELYEKKGYAKKFATAYKCSSMDVERRVKKLLIISNILNSNLNIYMKADVAFRYFKNSDDFKRQYSLLIKFGKNDDKLNKVRKQLDNFDLLLVKFKELEKPEIINTVKYVNSFKNEENNIAEINKYATFVIETYVNSNKSYKHKEFLNLLGIDKKMFDYCVSIVEEINPNLYDEYLKKVEVNNKIRYVSNVETINDLANGMNTGMLSTGVAFSNLEFLKRVPFKNDGYFYYTMKDFLERNMPEKKEIIMNYLSSNKYFKYYMFESINLKSLFDKKVKTIYNGVEITNKDNDIIISYIRVNDLPLINAVYYIVRDMYLNGEIDIEELEKKEKATREQRKYKKTILVPSVC